MEFDAGYAEWKGWRPATFGTLTAWDSLYLYREVFARIPGGAKAKLLDVGFGNGSILRAARDRGVDAYGVEANSVLVEMAAAQGFSVASDISGFTGLAADVVTLFDVLEHVSDARHVELVGEIACCLRPGGLLIIRVPNGDSPFALRNQNGDPTHISWIGSVKLELLALRSGFEVVFIGNPALVLGGSGPLRWVGRLIKYCMRRMIQWVIGFSYFGRNQALDDMLIAVFRKPPTV